MKISPTMLSTFEQSQFAWLRQYIGVPTRSVNGETWILVKMRDKQNEAMAAGSAFDAYIKSHLSGTLVPVTKSKYWSVEPWNQEYGIRIGKYLFDEYIKLGGVTMLQEEFGTHIPMMEEKIAGEIVINDSGNHAVQIGGFPDLFWPNNIRDWKVSQINNPKPTIAAGYQTLTGPASVLPARADSIIIDGKPAARHPLAGANLNDLLPKESTQLTFYGWLAGMGHVCNNQGSWIPEPILGGIDRLVGMPLRLVRYRGIITVDFQIKVMERLLACSQFADEWADEGEAALLEKLIPMLPLLTEKHKWF